MRGTTECILKLTSLSVIDPYVLCHMGLPLLIANLPEAQTEVFGNTEIAKRARQNAGPV
jgi:hypothetical protein